MEVLSPFKTITIAELKLEASNLIAQYNLFYDQFEQLNTAYLEKVTEVQGFLKQSGISTPKENKSVFSSHRPEALSKLGSAIANLAHQNNMEKVSSHNDENRSLDIQPFTFERLFEIHSEYLPKLNSSSEAIPSSYVKTIELYDYSFGHNFTITLLWNFCLALLGHEERIKKLTEKNQLVDGMYATPFFTINIKTINSDDDDFGNTHKMKIEFCPEVIAKLEENKNLLFFSNDVDDF